MGRWEQELGLAEYAAERTGATSASPADAEAAAEGAAWRGHFQAFYRLIYSHLETLVEVRSKRPRLGTAPPWKLQNPTWRWHQPLGQ